MYRIPNQSFENKKTMMIMGAETPNVWFQACHRLIMCESWCMVMHNLYYAAY